MLTDHFQLLICLSNSHCILIQIFIYRSPFRYTNKIQNHFPLTHNFQLN